MKKIKQVEAKELNSKIEQKEKIRKKLDQL